MANNKKQVKSSNTDSKSINTGNVATSFGGATASVATENKPKADLLFGKENFKWMLIGIVVMVIGYFLMSGGKMPSRDVWDDDIIYSFRRTTLAPIVILTGLAIEVYAIFKK